MPQLCSWQLLQASHDITLLQPIQRSDCHSLDLKLSHRCHGGHGGHGCHVEKLTGRETHQLSGVLGLCAWASRYFSQKKRLNLFCDLRFWILVVVIRCLRSCVWAFWGKNKAIQIQIIYVDVVAMERLRETNCGYFIECVWVFCTYFGSQYYVKVKKKLALLFA